MSSLVERLRIRSDRRPLYSLDVSDDEAEFEQRPGRTTQEKPERVVRTDAVSLPLYLLFVLFQFRFCCRHRS